MILNIHGYVGFANNAGFEILKQLNCGEFVISPQFDYDIMSPDDIYSYLFDMLVNFRFNAENGLHIKGKAADEDGIIRPKIFGHSLGGFWAYCLGAELNVPVLLKNPCFKPWETLPKCDVFEVNDEYMAKYKALFERYMYKLDKSKVSAVIGIKDELIDHSDIDNVAGTVYRLNGEHSLPVTPEFSEVVEKWVKSN